MPFKNIKNNKEFGREMNDQLVKFQKAFASTIPKKVAQKLGEMASKAFDQEQYTDGKSSPWKKRYKNKDEGRKLLVKTTELARSYQDTEYNVSGDTVTVSIGSDKVYAQIHNEGGEIKKGASEKVVHFKYAGIFKSDRGPGEKVKFSKSKGSHFAQKVNIGAHTITMPQRQVIPIPGEELPPDTQKEIDDYIDGIMDNILG